MQVVKGAAVQAARCGTKIFRYPHDFILVEYIFSDIYEYHKLKISKTNRYLRMR
jgi:hypothetical protein